MLNQCFPSKGVVAAEMKHVHKACVGIFWGGGALAPCREVPWNSRKYTFIKFDEVIVFKTLPPCSICFIVNIYLVLVIFVAELPERYYWHIWHCTKGIFGTFIVQNCNNKLKTPIKNLILKEILVLAMKMGSLHFTSHVDNSQLKKYKQPPTHCDPIMQTTCRGSLRRI